jgi:hypothetical protein
MLKIAFFQSDCIRLLLLALVGFTMWIHAVETRTYSIGGFYPVSTKQFVQNWSPIFEGYLNEVVGPQFQPPINFSLIPVDFAPAVTSQALLNAGKLDFICNFIFHELGTICLSLI